MACLLVVYVGYFSFILFLVEYSLFVRFCRFYFSNCCFQLVNSTSVLLVVVKNRVCIAFECRLLIRENAIVLLALPFQLSIQV